MSVGTAPRSAPVGETVAGNCCSGVGGSGSWGLVGSSRETDAAAGAPGGGGGAPAADFPAFEDVEDFGDFEDLGDFAAGVMSLAYPWPRGSMHPRRRVWPGVPPGRPAVSGGRPNTPRLEGTDGHDHRAADGGPDHRRVQRHRSGDGAPARA